MKVKDLIMELSKLDSDASVYLQIDPEGNGHYEVRGVDPSVNGGKEHDYTIYSRDWSAEDCMLEEDEWEKLKNSKKHQIVVVYP